MTTVPVASPTRLRVLIGLLWYVRRYQSRVFLAFALSIFGVLVDLLRPWPIQIIVDYVLSDRPRPRWLSAWAGWLPSLESRDGLLGWAVGLAILVAIASAALSWLALRTRASRRSCWRG